MASRTDERTFGPALVAIGCVWQGCAQTVEIAFSETTKNLSCDRRIGRDGIFHFDPMAEITVNASDFTLANLAILYDSTVTTWAGTATSTLEEFSITWSGSSGDWSGTVDLNGEISGTVSVFSDAAGGSPWPVANSGTVTVTGPCLGLVALTSSGTAEPAAALYATYAWGDQVPSGSSIIQPSFGSSAIEYPVVIIHKKAQENTLIVHRFWRTEVIRDSTLTYDNESDSDITVPIKLAALVDTVGHPGVPLFDLSEIDMAGALFDPDYVPYTTAETLYPIT